MQRWRNDNRTSTVQGRVDDATKTEAQANLEALGLDVSTYINMSLKALNREKAIPFKLSLKPTSELAQAITEVKAGHLLPPTTLAEHLEEAAKYTDD